MSLILSSFISPASPSKSSGRSQPFRSSSSRSLEIVTVLAPLRKHGPKRSYTEDRTLSLRAVQADEHTSVLHWHKRRRPQLWNRLSNYWKSFSATSAGSQLTANSQ